MDKIKSKDDILQQIILHEFVLVKQLSNGTIEKILKTGTVKELEKYKSDLLEKLKQSNTIIDYELKILKIEHK